MNLAIIQKTMALRYDGAPMWPISGSDNTAEWAMVDQSLNASLVHRRLWVAAFANPLTTGEPTFRLRVRLEDESGANVDLFDWTPTFAAVGGFTEILPGFTDIRPPFALSSEMDLSRSSAAHSGSGDARVIQFKDPLHISPTSILRCTMWPVDLTARLKRVRFTISDFSLGSGTGSDQTGNIFTAFCMHSQAFPF